VYSQYSPYENNCHALNLENCVSLLVSTLLRASLSVDLDFTSLKERPRGGSRLNNAHARTKRPSEKLTREDDLVLKRASMTPGNFMTRVIASYGRADSDLIALTNRARQKNLRAGLLLPVVEWRRR